MTAIWWIRRDLRLTDNPALHAALQADFVIPVFIIDPAFSSSSPRRKHFLYGGLHALDNMLRNQKSQIIIRTGRPVEVLTKLVRETHAEIIYAEEDFTPYARNRDNRISKTLPLQLIHGQTVHPPTQILKPDGTPYTIFTPYSRTWRAKLNTIKLLPSPEAIRTPSGIPTERLPEYDNHPQFPVGEHAAKKRLEEFLHYRIHEYDIKRNALNTEGTSLLSPYLHFGILGLRQAANAATIAELTGRNTAEKHAAETWLNELIWREFYIQILYHFPHVIHKPFNAALGDIPWRNHQAEYNAWKEGLTGIPIVDAGMRQLKKSGWMHNRARMITASFLVKDLLIDWRWGEAWFMENLIDGDLAANNGGWQWSAGTGTDAAPYFRIFNPVLQSKKFDPDGHYIRNWVPELAKLSSKEIHAPWEFNLTIHGYPDRPIVNHNIARERTLMAYASSKSLHQTKK